MKTNKSPLRQCVGCRGMKSKKDLVRILRTPEGDICLDETGRKNGRGAYLCPRSECLAKARKNKGLSRTLKTEVPPEIYSLLEEEIQSLEE